MASAHETLQWIEAKVVFHAENNPIAADLIADVFYETGVKGVVVEDPDEECTEIGSEDTYVRPEAHGVIGYFPLNQSVEADKDALNEGLRRLTSLFPMTYELTFRTVAETDWAEAWKAHFHPRKISPRLVVKPSWREYQPSAGEEVIELDPGMAFGTGTHPTTVLCMQLIEKYLKPGDHLLDVGTGSGILMAAAAKLGAGFVRGVDVDPRAVDIAEQNLRRNGVDPERFQVTRDSLAAEVTQRFDLVAANILSEVILQLLPRILPRLKRSGRLICSGITAGGLNAVTDALDRLAFTARETVQCEEWFAVTARAPVSDPKR